MTTTKTLLPALTAAVALAFSAPAADAQTFTVTGKFQYEDKAWDYNGWTGSDPILPIRRADVYVLNDATQAVLGSGSTGQDGTFSIEATSAGVVDISVRADCDSALEPTFQRIRVTTNGNSEYSTFSPVFNGHDTSNDLDVGTNTAGKILQGGEEANPFNLFDMGVHAWEYITGPLVGEGNANQTIRLYWPGGSGSFASGNDATIADDDGYDDAVILHEIGHVVHNKYSDSDNTGGSHFFGDSDQDPRLSFGEGYASFFAGTVFNQIGVEAIYMDANGASQSGGVGLRLRMETVSPYANDANGAADEVAVCCALYDLLDTENSPDGTPTTDDDLMVSTSVIGAGLSPHRAWWDTFEGPVASAANLTQNDAWDGWFSEHGKIGGLYDSVKDCFERLDQNNFEDVDEPNNTIGTATPTVVQTSSNWSGERTLFSGDPAPGTGDEDWYAHELVKGSDLLFRTRYPGASTDADTQVDTFLELFDPSGVLVLSDEDSGTGRNAFIDSFVVTETGTWTVRIKRGGTASYRRYGTYNYRAKHNFENFVPLITSGPTAMPTSILDTETSDITVTATDAQTLTYAWSTPDGGTILGSGASVTFDPPPVGVSTGFRVQVVAMDSLGAESALAEVIVTVDPSGGTCGQSAAVASGGVGKAGLLGIPTLSTTNLPVVPSSDHSLDASGFIPFTSGTMIFGLSLVSAPFDQGTMYPSPDILIPMLSDGLGNAGFPIVVPNDPILCGLHLWAQAMFANDPGAIGSKQTAQTNYVELTFGS